MLSLMTLKVGESPSSISIRFSLPVTRSVESSKNVALKSPVMVGESLTPSIVIVMGLVDVSPLLSITVTLKVS